MSLAFMVAQRRQHEIERRNRFDRLAHHEAAHAVVAASFAIEVSGLHIGFGEGGGERGQCCAQQSARPAFERLTLLSAGAVAERKLCGDIACDWEDRERAHQIALAECPHGVADAWALLERACYTADDLVTRN